MREIKFRAWDKKNKIMFVIFDSTTHQDWFLPSWKDKHEVMQYTGLKDVVGKEIFEGDIILDNSYGKDVGALIGAVVFSSHMGAYVWSNDETALIAESCCTIMVIGNVWENQELIESEG